MLTNSVGEGIFQLKISVGNVISSILVVVALITLFLQQQASHNQDVRTQEDHSNAITALASRVSDLSDRIQALSLGSTQRFTSLDDALSQVSKRVDSLQVTDQNINDRLVIQEAKGQALEEEIKTIVESKQSTRRD